VVFGMLYQIKEVHSCFHGSMAFVMMEQHPLSNPKTKLLSSLSYHIIILDNDVKLKIFL